MSKINFRNRFQGALLNGIERGVLLANNERQLQFEKVHLRQKLAEFYDQNCFMFLDDLFVRTFVISSKNFIIIIEESRELA